jgi:hypothetical protein
VEGGGEVNERDEVNKWGLIEPSTQNKPNK